MIVVSNLVENCSNVKPLAFIWSTDGVSPSIACKRRALAVFFKVPSGSDTESGSSMRGNDRSCLKSTMMTTLANKSFCFGLSLTFLSS